MTIRALIFDFDGTIVDTESLDFACWQEIYDQYGCELHLDAWSQCVGTVTDKFHPVTHLEQLTGKPLQRDHLEGQHIQEFRRRAVELPLLDGIKAWLNEACTMGLRLGVASSSQREWVQMHLEKHGLLEQFQAVRTANDVSHVKPDPELYFQVAAALGVAPEEAVAIEDSPNGLRAARSAGMRCIAVPNPITRQLGPAQADLNLSSLQDMSLKAALAALASL